MFHVGYVLNNGHVQFGDFLKCLSIFRKATKLQKNRKQEIKERERERERETYLELTWQPTYLAFYCSSPAHHRSHPCRLPPRTIGCRRVAGARGHTPRPPPASLPVSPSP